MCQSILAKAGVPINSVEPWSIQVYNEKLWDRLMSQHQLGLGEAYIEGWWDCQAIDQLVARLLDIDVLSLLRPSPVVLYATFKSVVINRQTKSRAENNAKHHYNIGNDLYSRMLDKEMAYSCAYWKNTENLNQAQINKFDLICKKLKLEPGMTVLDIGSGWGGFLRHAVKNYHVIGYGVTPADNQIDEARARSSGFNITYTQQDYREVFGQYDRVVSVGMMEHVGPKNLKEFFLKCNELLKQDGIILHHTITSTHSKLSTDPYFDRYIFPGGVIPSPGQICSASEKLFATEDIHNIGLHYDPTLMSWFKNINERWHEIPQYTEKFQRMWNYYLMASAAAFRTRNLHLMQIVFRKNGVQSEYIPVR